MSIIDIQILETTRLFDGAHDFRVISVEPTNGCQLRWQTLVGGHGAFVPAAGGEYEAPTLPLGIAQPNTYLEAYLWGHSNRTHLVIEVDD